MDYLNPWLKLQDALDTFFLIFSFARKCLKRLFCFLSSPLSTISIRGEKQGVGCGNSRLKTEVVEKQHTQDAARIVSWQHLLRRGASTWMLRGSTWSSVELRGSISNRLLRLFSAVEETRGTHDHFTFHQHLKCNRCHWRQKSGKIIIFKQSLTLQFQLS